MSELDKKLGYSYITSSKGLFQFAGDLEAFKELEGFMTGQEWYDRFSKNLEYQLTDFGEYGRFIRPEYADFAAKKAASIE